MAECILALALAQREREGALLGSSEELAVRGVRIRISETEEQEKKVEISWTRVILAACALESRGARNEDVMRPVNCYQVWSMNTR